MEMSAEVLLTIVIPVKNEEESLLPLALEINEAFKEVVYRWNVMWVDDGSTDDTLERLKSLSGSHHWISLRENMGQSAAFIAGVQQAQGEWIGSLDGDGQNDPRDLIVQLGYALTHGLDMVNGIRAKRNDNFVRRFSSKLANKVRNYATGRSVTDVGCSTRVVRREAVLKLPFFHGMHRFIPTLVKLYGYDISEIPVNHRVRELGRSKYGINNRLWSGMVDILGVMWLRKRYRNAQIAKSSADKT